MSATQHPHTDVTGLTERELEILRLLAAGHTVKTIATRLDRTEASINERLRDARRKTGIGSSRELARLLDAQKNWDRKIDLPPQRTSTDSNAQPAGRGPTWPKGQRIMLITLPLAALGLIVAATPTLHEAASPQAVRPVPAGPSPLVGRWSLDVSRIPENERPQRVTIAFTVSEEGRWTSMVDIVGADGSSQHAQSTATLDGAPAPVTGTIAGINTVALRQPAPDTLVMTLGRDGVALSTRVYTVARDRQSMTETIVWAGADLPKLETTYFNRIE